MKRKLFLFLCVIAIALCSTNLNAQSKGRIAWLGNNLSADSLYFVELTKAGYTVVDKTATKGNLNTDSIAVLNSFDLVIMSRSLNSGDYNFPAVYDSITAPLLCMANMAARDDRWKMTLPTFNGDGSVQDVMLAKDLTHPIFNNIELSSTNTLAIASAGIALKPLTGLKTAGNGKIIGATEIDTLVLIAEWDANQPYYEGSTLTAHGKRMLYFNTQGSNAKVEGVVVNNLTNDGYQLLKNICEYLITGDVFKYKGNIAWLGNNLVSDSSYFVELTKAGYNVVDKTATKGRLNADQLADLNSFDLVIMSRSLNSGDYNFPAAYDSITAPLLCMANMAARDDRWKMTLPTFNGDGSVQDVLSVKDLTHPIFTDIKLSETNTIAIANAGIALKPLTGLKTAGNGRILGATDADTLVLIAEWDANQPYYEGSLYTNHGKRMLFFNTQGSNSVINEVKVENLNSDGYKLLTNIVEYMITGKVTKLKGEIAWLGNNLKADSLYFVELSKAGYKVVDKTATKGRLNADQLADINSFDLVIMSRSLNSGDYNFPAAYDSITAPLLCMANMAARDDRWKMTLPTFNGDGSVQDVLTVKDLTHPIFNNITLSETNTIDIATPGIALKPLSGLKTAGNGRILGATDADTLVLVAEWDANEPYYEGSTFTNHGKRMLYFNTQGSNATVNDKVVSNLSKNGYLLLSNIAEYMITGKVAKPGDDEAVNVILITEQPVTDSLYVALLAENGCNVTVVSDLNNVVPSDSALAVLEDADVILFSRNTSSNSYAAIDKYNKLATPIMLMNAYMARSNRWKFLNSDAFVDNDADTLTAQAITHPIFAGVNLGELNQVVLNDSFKVSTLPVTTAPNATVIASSSTSNNIVIAEWKKNTMFYEPAGTSAIGHRMGFFLTNTFDLTADGQKMFVNAVKYLATFDYDTLLVNVAPTDIKLSRLTVAENVAIGTPIGTLTTIDANTADTWSYSIVAGEGDTNNAFVAISGDKLITAAEIDFETVTSLAIRINTTDNGGLSYEKAFTIEVTNVNEAPTEITLSNSTIDEEQPAGTLVGILSATDVDANSSFVYVLKNATDGSSADNKKFVIVGDSLKTKAVLDFETQATYNILIQVSDGLNTFVKAFVITVNDVTEVGIEEYLSNVILSYPNPFTDKLYIRSEKDGEATILIYNANGQVVYSRKHTLGNALEINPQVPAGVYILEIQGNNYKHSSRIVRK